MPCPYCVGVAQPYALNAKDGTLMSPPDPAPITDTHGRENRRWRLGLCLVSVGVLAAVAAWQHIAQTRPNHLRTVVAGVLYRSAWPTESQLAGVVKRHGIRTVVNLCLQDEEVSCQDGNWEREVRQCRELGVSLVHFRLPGNTPPTEEQAREWLRICATPASQPVLVHCAQGVIRTNGVVAIYQVDTLGLENETVLHGLPAFGHHLFKPKRKKLNDFILAWKPGQAQAGIGGAPSVTVASTAAH
jgi:protein tyrosine phosphatase (PTP) superfamily phosphohydrolase (DUF442 family)